MPRWSLTIKAFSPTSVVTLLSLAIFLLHLVTIANLKPKIFDELYYASAALSYLEGRIVFDVQPPLGKEIIAVGLALFGDQGFGWRFIPALFHTLLIPLTYLTTKTLFKDRSLALMASILVALENLLFGLGQIALLEVLAAFFLLSAVGTATRYQQTLSGRWLLLTGMTLGASVAVKWTTLLPALVILSFLVIHLPAKARLQTLFTLVATGLGTYLISFYPHLQNQENLFLWHQSTLDYHLNFPKSHQYHSYWWEWFLDKQAVWVFFERAGSQIRSLLLLGNPVIFLLQILALIWALRVKLWRRPPWPFLLLLITVGWGQWAAVAGKSFLYHLAPTLPLNLILIAYFLKERHPKRLRLILTVIVIGFCLILPFQTGWWLPDYLMVLVAPFWH